VKLSSTSATTGPVARKKTRRARPQPVAISKQMRKPGDDKSDDSFQHRASSDIHLDRDAEHLRVMVDSIKVIAYNLRGENSAQNEHVDGVATAHLNTFASTLDYLRRLSKQIGRQCVVRKFVWTAWTCHGPWRYFPQTRRSR